MKVLLVAVPLMDRDNGNLIPLMMDKTRDMPPLGVYLLAQVLRDNGCSVSVLDLIAEGKIDDRRIIETAGLHDVVGISINSLNWPTAKYIIEVIRKAGLRLPIVLGGVHASLYDEYLLSHFPVNYVIRGEGEKSLWKLLRYLKGKVAISGVEGLSYIDKKGNFVRNAPNEPLSIAELEALPAPAYDLLPNGVYHGLSIESGRGCRFSCAFCSIPFRSQWRAWSARSFVRMAEQLEPFLGRVQKRCFHIVDDCFTLDRKRVLDIVRLFDSSSLRFKAALDARCSDITDEHFAKELSKITKMMLLGAECGYDLGLRRLGKGITVETIERSARLLHKVGLANRAVYSFILGLPWEKYRDVIKTVSLATSLATRYGVTLYLQWHSLLPGSEIWNKYAKDGEVDIGMYDDFGFFDNEYLTRKAVSLTPAEVLRIAHKVATLKVLLGTVGVKNRPMKELIHFSFPRPMKRNMEYKAATGKGREKVNSIK